MNSFFIKILSRISSKYKQDAEGVSWKDYFNRTM
jgi:hypothetical protein